MIRRWASRVAIIGSGPSGFYTAKYLLKARKDVRVDMIEQWPVPFGLVRFGVAPDHPEVKSVASDFEDVASDERFRFIGNYRVESLDFRAKYSAVVIACGCSVERPLGLPGEDLQGVVSARAFVGWYNSEPIPRHYDLPHDLKAVVIGQGNVALDCARILVSKDLDKTDVSRDALKVLDAVGPRSVSVVGRRGAAQAAFTIKELRELSEWATVRKSELEAGDTAASLVEMEGRAAQRKRKLIDTFVDRDVAGDRVELRFLLSPKRFEGANGKLESVVFERCELSGEPHAQKAKPTGELVTIPANLALVAVGYLGLPPSFDGPPRVVPHLDHTNGRVNGQSKLYCAGWIKRGPSGIIGTNIADAKETVTSILEDLADDDAEGITPPPTSTTWDDWHTIKRHEPPKLSYAQMLALLR